MMSEALGVGYFFKRILIDSSAHPAILYLTPVNAALLSSPPKPLELPRVGFAEKPLTVLSCASPQNHRLRLSSHLQSNGGVGAANAIEGCVGAATVSALCTCQFDKLLTPGQDRTGDLQRARLTS